MPLDDKKKYIYFKLAAELSLYDVEAKMHERFYPNALHKPLFKNVLLGRLGYIKYIRGDEDDLYRKYWNRYCRIINSNKFKPLIIKDSQDNRLLNMLNCIEEGLNVEFKEYYKKERLLESVNSFLNSDSGGQLFFGIKDITNDEYGNKLFVTKGDHNNAIDYDKVHLENVKGKVAAIIPLIGYPSVWLSGAIS